jgi:hypothetical protein
MSHSTGQWPYFLKEDNYLEAFQGVIRTYFKDYDPSKKVIIRDTSLYLDTTALSRLKELNPDVKVILSIREPVARAYSAFCFGRSKGFETEEDFGRIIAAQKLGPYITDQPLICNYIRMGMYYRNIKAIESVLPKERLFILLASDLRENPVRTCDALFSFLNLPEMEVSAVIANQTRRSRMEELAFLMRKDTPLKRAFKAVLPLGARLKMRRVLAKMNTTDSKYPPISEEHEAALQEIFREENYKLLAEYGIGFTETISRCQTDRRSRQLGRIEV